MTESTKLEPLPWFAFNIGDYVKDTMRLTTEAHGAYLLLCLDYYATGEPCPDDDFILAAVAKLPVEAWKNHRKVLASFFEVRAGHWHHNRIEREMRDASVKHKVNVERTRAANEARWGGDRKTDGKTVASPAQESPKSTSPKRQRQRNVKVEEEVTTSSTSQHLQTHTTTPFSRSSSDDDDAQASESDFEIGTPIDPGFSLAPSQVEICRADGATDDEVAMQVRLFIAYNTEHGTFSPNWINTWSLWWTRHLERRAKETAKAPPRIEVNAKAPDPNETIDRAVALFAKGGPWSHKAFGPEPGQIGCRIAPAVIEKHGLDPKTGMKLRMKA